MTKQYFPKVMNNIQSWLLFEKKTGNIYSIGCSDNDYYLKVNQYQLPFALAAVKDMNGLNSYNTLIEKYREDIDIVSLIKNLEVSGLVINSDKRKERNEYEKYSFILVDFPIQRLFKHLKNISVLLNHSFLKFLASIFILISFLVFSLKLPVYMTDPNTYLVYSSDTLNIFIYLLVSILSICIHEFAHGITATYYNIFPKRFSAVLYMYFNPVFYLKIPGLYTLAPKQRINVWGAGMFVNSFISSVCLWLFQFNNNPLLLMIVVVNVTLIVTNINPFLPLDGYFIVSTVLKETNLRKKLFSIVRGEKLRNQNLFIYLYLFVSLLFLIILILTQIIWLVRLIINSLYTSNTILAFLYNIRIIFIFLGILLFVSIVKKKSYKEEI
ncbi:M50 family metallopeptidase [Enterococcus rotai]|uniref:M50 family metallopeptidase n=1 Tax=Enterococcus rotai TaxID=118060 RepID=UPI0032B47C61